MRLSTLLLPLLTSAAALRSSAHRSEIVSAQRIEILKPAPVEAADRMVVAGSGRYDSEWTVLGGVLAVPCTRNPL